MLSRVIAPGTTTYMADYTRKNVQRQVGRNLSTLVTTGSSYVQSPKALYRTDFSDSTENRVYKRSLTFKMDMTQLPPEYASSVRPELARPTDRTDYQHYFGRLGESATLRQMAMRSRTLSRQTRANVCGTTRSTHHPPLYAGAVPSEWKGNNGKFPHEDRNLQDLTWQFHCHKTGYSGYIAAPDMTGAARDPVARTSTTYREMCDELGYTME